MTVEELSARMTAREMNEWRALFILEHKEEEERELEREAQRGMDSMRRIGFGRSG